MGAVIAVYFVFHTQHGIANHVLYFRQNLVVKIEIGMRFFYYLLHFVKRKLVSIFKMAVIF